jgi:hypothetical protein
VRGRHVAPACRWRAALAVAASAVMFAAVARAAAPKALRCVRLRLADPDADARALLARLGDVLAEDFPGVDLGTAPSLAGDRLFRADDPDVACLTAWVVVEPTRALVRVASAGRCRYVFREVGVEHPLSELDRERVAQVAKAALSAIDDDSPEAPECAPPPVVVAPPPSAAQVSAPPFAAPPPSAATPTAIRTPASSGPSSSLAIGASYGGTYHLGSVWQGPSLLMAVREPTWPREPEVWLDLRYVLPHSFDTGGDTTQTIAGRAGVSLRAWPYVRLGLGVGVDRERSTFELLSPGAGAIPSRYTSWQPAARVFTRVSTRSWKGFSLSETLFLDAVHSPDPQNTFRAGLTFEAWWRS